MTGLKTIWALCTKQSSLVYFHFMKRPTAANLYASWIRLRKALELNKQVKNCWLYQGFKELSFSHKNIRKSVVQTLIKRHKNDSDKSRHR